MEETVNVQEYVPNNPYVPLPVQAYQWEIGNFKKINNKYLRPTFNNKGHFWTGWFRYVFFVYPLIYVTLDVYLVILVGKYLTIELSMDCICDFIG